MAGLTLKELGMRAGIGFSTISKVEKGTMSPTYENILRLAQGLGIDVELLFTHETTDVGTGRRSVTAARGGVPQKTPAYIYEMLHTDLRNKKLIPIFATITARTKVDINALRGHAGEEFIYVLKGSVDIQTTDYEVIHLEEGDSCYFDSRMGHACTSTSKEDAHVLWVCSSADAERHIQEQLDTEQR